MLVTITTTWRHRTMEKTIVYPPGNYVLTDELAELAKAAGVVEKKNGKRADKSNAAGDPDTPESAD